jgi:LexA-binding, inner membrane-associated putative hydrolase
MFIGHFAVAFAAKPAAPSVSLGTLVLACEWVDLVWPVLLLAGIERVEIRPGVTAFTPLDFVHYPWTHSLLMCAVWAAVFGLLYFLSRKNGKAALIVAAVVLSHWFLDLVAHRPDLPLVPGSDSRFGLGLWSSIPATLAFEAALFAAAFLLYIKRTRALDRIGRWGLWGVVLFLLAAYLGAAFGPPPPSVEAIAWAGLIGGAVTALLGYWVDRHRTMAA